MNKLAVSAEFVRPGKVGGAEQQLRNLLGGLVHALGGADTLAIIGPELWPELAGGQARYVAPPKPFSNRFVQETLSFAKLSGGFGAVLYPNYFTPPGSAGPRLLTIIHDLAYLHHPDHFSFRKRQWLRAAHAFTLRRAHKVIAISEFVKRDILDRFGRRWEGKLSVLPNPISWERLDAPAPGDAETASGGHPYILGVAAHYPNKNLATLLRAFALVARAEPDAKLVLAGQLAKNLIGSRGGPDVPGMVEALGLRDKVEITGYVPDRRLGQLYRNARVFVFPSVFEGFGMPPVEALGLGLPVLTTARTSLPEVTKGYARYLDDPLDPAEMADKLLAMFRTPDRFRPDAGQVRDIRASFDPGAIGKRLYGLMTGE